jgi:hypothetical protein
MREVSFADFAKLAAKRGHSVESLASRFRGKIEHPSEFLERVMTCKYKNKDHSGVLIPYGSVIEFYSQELHSVQESNVKHKRCACGCGQAVFDRKKWALPGCRQKIARKQSTDMQKGDCQVAEFVEARL